MFYASKYLRLLLGLGSLLAGCEKPNPQVVRLLLTAPISLTPTAATAHVGDTLWLEMHCSDSLVDFRTNQRYRVTPQDLGLACAFFIGALQGPGQLSTGAARTVRVVPQVGQAGGGGTFTGTFDPVYDGHAYHAKFGLVLTQPGILSISLLLGPGGGKKELGKFLPFIHLPPDAQGREQKALLEDMYFIVNEGKANNFPLYCQYATVNPQTGNLSTEDLIYDERSRFTVEVK